MSFRVPSSNGTPLMAYLNSFPCEYTSTDAVPLGSTCGPSNGVSVSLF